MDAIFCKLCMETRRFFSRLDLEKVMIREMKCICPIYIVKIDWLGMQGYRQK